MELLYGRLIQWTFLESKARKCLQDQDKQATVCADQVILVLEFVTWNANIVIVEGSSGVLSRIFTYL